MIFDDFVSRKMQNFNGYEKFSISMLKIKAVNPVKGSSDLKHLIFEINVGKSRIRHSLCHIERL